MMYTTNRMSLLSQITYCGAIALRLKGKDFEVVEIIPWPVQKLDVARFDELSAGDTFVVDSSHVAKAGRDVNHILSEILPRLSQGVFVHFHDMAIRSSIQRSGSRKDASGTRIMSCELSYSTIRRSKSASGISSSERTVPRNSARVFPYV